LVTGEAINPSPEIEGVDDMLTEIKIPKSNESEDIMGAVPQEEDAAAKWLRAEEARLKKEKKRRSQKSCITSAF